MKVYNKKFKILYACFLFCILFTIIFSAIYFQLLATIPNELFIINGEDYVWQYKFPISLVVEPEKQANLILNGSIAESKGIKISSMSSLKLRSENDSTAKLNFKLLGIPIKTMTVDSLPRKKVIPCGNAIGVKINTDGPLVIGMSDIESIDGKIYEPYKEANIKTGDYIVEVNNRKIINTDLLAQIIERSQGEYVTLKIKRNDNYFYSKIKPVKSNFDSKYKVGLWLRENTAGIGTMTFYDPVTKVFGALGHGITDVDTGGIISIREGDVLNSDITSVKKGVKGIPGELRGIFVSNSSKSKIGSVLLNNECGIFGLLNTNGSNLVNQSNAVEIALRSEIKEGPAKIISCISGGKTDYYDIDIQKIYRQSLNSSKSMVIKITDKRLLSYTGGIVQGMSGSPIIQNGKLVGAVTHVLVNDPTKGYGVFIEWMIKKALTISSVASDRLSAAS